MKLRVQTKWLTEAKFNLGERKYSNGSKASPYTKKQATRETRRNGKALIKYEILTQGEIK